jgi:hypothetical protein
LKGSARRATARKRRQGRRRQGRTPARSDETGGRGTEGPGQDKDGRNQAGNGTLLHGTPLFHGHAYDIKTSLPNRFSMSARTSGGRLPRRPKAASSIRVTLAARKDTQSEKPHGLKLTKGSQVTNRVTEQVYCLTNMWLYTRALYQNMIFLLFCPM